MSAGQTLGEILGLKTDRAETLRFLGEAGYLWMYLGQFDKALTVFDGVTLLAPHDPVAHLGRSEIYLRQGKFKESERSATEATKMANATRGAQAFAHVLRGQALMSQNRVPEAQQAWDKASELDPNGAGKQLVAARMEVARMCGLLPKT